MALGDEVFSGWELPGWKNGSRSQKQMTPPRIYVQGSVKWGIGTKKERAQEDHGSSSPDRNDVSLQWLQGRAWFHFLPVNLPGRVTWLDNQKSPKGPSLRERPSLPLEVH